MRPAAWFRIFLAVLTVQPTFAHAAAATPQEARSKAPANDNRQATYVVDLNWSQVQRLSPGTEIMVRKPGVALVRQRVRQRAKGCGDTTFVVTTSRSEIESGSVTLSTPPVKARLSGAAKLCIGISICVAAWYTYMLILLRGMD